MFLTKKDIKRLSIESNLTIVQVGYSDIVNEVPAYVGAVKIGYNAGIYGWNWDAYIINNYIVVGGHRNLIGKKVKFNVLIRDGNS